MYSTKQKGEPTIEQFSSYQALYHYFNKKLFSGELPPIILNFSRKDKTAGFFAPNRWVSQSGENKTHEISINPSYMARVPFIEVCQTLVHEQAHLWQMLFGKPSRKGYHNKEWAKKMEAIGLMPSSTGQEGGNTVGQKMSDYVLPGGQFEKVFKSLPESLGLPWVANEETAAAAPGNGAEQGEQEEEKPPKKKTKVKYTCPQCGMKLWGKPELQVYCKPCETYLEEEK